MTQASPRYDVEFKRRMVELVQQGRTLNSLSREYGPAARTIRQWLKAAGVGIARAPVDPGMAPSGPPIGHLLAACAALNAASGHLLQAALRMTTER